MVLNPQRATHMRPSEALSRHRDSILRVTARVKASNVRVFGSVVRGEDTEASDLDLLVDVPKGTTLLDMAGLQRELEDALGVSVDVVTLFDLPGRVRTRVQREARML